MLHISCNVILNLKKLATPHRLKTVSNDLRSNVMDRCWWWCCVLLLLLMMLLAADAAACVLCCNRSQPFLRCSQRYARLLSERLVEDMLDSHNTTDLRGQFIYICFQNSRELSLGLCIIKSVDRFNYTEA